MLEGLTPGEGFLLCPSPGETLGGDTLKVYFDRPESYALFESLILSQWRSSGMDVDTVTAGVSFYLGLNPQSPVGDRLSGYYSPDKKWIVIPKLWWELGMEEPYMLTMHHELGHHIHCSFMGIDGGVLWQEWAALTGKRLDFGSYQAGTKEVPNTPSYEDFANDFARTVDGRHKGEALKERRRFYFGLWGQKSMRRKIELTIGSKTATVDGKAVELDVPAQIRDGRTLVPFRFVGEAFGAKVDYFPKVGRVERITAELEVAL